MLTQRECEFNERIAHQSATINVLKAMPVSPGDPTPVFDLIVRRAYDLCDSPNVALTEYAGELVRLRSVVLMEGDPAGNARWTRGSRNIRTVNRNSPVPGPRRGLRQLAQPNPLSCGHLPVARSDRPPTSHAPSRRRV